MHRAETPRVGYVLKRYPRYSETFVVNEILAHEAAGLELSIFALRPPTDSHFQDAIARVRAPVCYLPYEGVRAVDFWAELDAAGRELPGFWGSLAAGGGEEARDVHQAVVLARLVRRSGIGHLHAHFASSATSVARLAARFAGVSYSFTAHAKDIYHESVDHEDLRRKLRDASAAVTVSDYNLRFLEQRYGPDAGALQRVYNGLELDRLPYRTPDEREPVVVSVGRLVEKKGFDDLIEACVLLKRSGRRFSCRIVGEGELEAELRARIAALGLDDTVELTGPRPQCEVFRLVQRAAVFVQPCVVGRDGNRDGLPTVLLEAMALGTPVVSTDVTGIPEILHDGETGLMVRQHDPSALAAATARLLEDRALRVRLSRRARRLIEAEFDVQRNAALLRELVVGRAVDAAAPSAAPLCV